MFLSITINCFKHVGIFIFLFFSYGPLSKRYLSYRNRYAAVADHCRTLIGHLLFILRKAELLLHPNTEYSYIHNINLLGNLKPVLVPYPELDLNATGHEGLSPSFPAHPRRLGGYLSR